MEMMTSMVKTMELVVAAYHDQCEYGFLFRPISVS